jgi:hypothetical protein
MYSTSRDLLAQIQILIGKYRDPYTGHFHPNEVSATTKSKVERMVRKYTPKSSALKFDGLGALRYYAVLKFSIPTALVIPDYQLRFRSQEETWLMLDNEEVGETIWENMPIGIYPEAPGTTFKDIEWDFKPRTDGKEIEILVLF